MASHKWSVRYTCSTKDCGNIVSRLRDLSSVCVQSVPCVFSCISLARILDLLGFMKVRDCNTPAKDVR